MLYMREACQASRSSHITSTLSLSSLTAQEKIKQPEGDI